MEKRIFHWPISKYYIDLYSVVLICISFFISMSNCDVRVRYSAIILFILSLLHLIYQIVHKLVNPELEFRTGVLKFYDNLNKPKKRISVSVHNIDTIIEIMDDPAEVGMYIGVPTFLIKTKSGDEYEYVPVVKAQKRVDEIKIFLRSCPGMPFIKRSDEKSLNTPGSYEVSN